MLAVPPQLYYSNSDIDLPEFVVKKELKQK